MDFDQVLKRRRMVRHFRPDPVPRKILERIGAAAQRAPSAGFSQGQRLIIVTDPDLMRRIAAMVSEDEYTREGFHPWVSQCGAQLIPCVSERLYHERYQQPDKVDEHGREMDWPVPYWWMDIGCTVMLILLAAINEGLAAGFAGPFPVPQSTLALQAELEIPEHFTPVGVIPVGWPLEDRRSPSLKRGKLRSEDFVRWQRW